MSRMQRSLFAELNALAEEISAGAEKVAAEKSAAPCPADPGGYKGPSSHPSASADNNCQPASEGERSRENASDVKDQQRAPAVDNTPEMSQEGRQDDVQLNIGTHAAATGEDPAAEKDFKGTKDDPGTSHPAKTNDGEKYSSVSFKEARARCTDLANDVLAQLVSAPQEVAEKESELHGDQHKLDVDNDGKIEGADLAKLRNGKGKKEDAEKKADEAAAETVAEAVEDDNDAEIKQAYAEGYELAEALEWEKEAAEASVHELCANTLRETDEMADMVIGWLSKQAEADIDDVANAEDHSSPADALSGAGESPEAAMTDAADIGADEGEMVEEEPSDDESIQELAMALEELGIPPEALLGALGDEGEEAPVDPAAGAEEMPKIAADKTAAELDLIGRAVMNYKRSGSFQIKEARTKRSRLLRDEMKQHVLELVNR